MAGSLPRPDAGQDQLKEWRLDPGSSACRSDVRRFAVGARADPNAPGLDLVEDLIDEFLLNIHPVFWRSKIVVSMQRLQHSLSGGLVVEMVQAQRAVEQPRHVSLEAVQAGEGVL